MLKNISQLEIEVGGKIFKFLCDADSALPHIKSALDSFITFVHGLEARFGQPAQQAPDQPAQPAPEEQPKV